MTFCLDPSFWAESPKIVLVMADDVSFDAIGCYGSTSYPALENDRFARSEMRFNICFRMPVCHPTGVCLLTGQFPGRSKIRIKELFHVS